MSTTATKLGHADCTAPYGFLSRQSELNLGIEQVVRVAETEHRARAGGIVVSTMSVVLVSAEGKGK